MKTDTRTVIEKLLGVCPMCRRKFKLVGTYKGVTSCFTCNQINAVVDLMTDRMNQMGCHMDLINDDMDRMFIDMNTLKGRIKDIERCL